MVKQLVLQLARFGDIVQSKRLILSLLQGGEVYLVVDKSLEELAMLIYPKVHIIGIHAHNATAIQAGIENISILNDLQSINFDAVYPLNHSSLTQSVSTLFSPEILRGYSRNYTQERHSEWVRLAFRWMSDRQIAPINLVDFWANFAQNPLDPRLVNPIAEGHGKGIGVVLAGQNSRRSLKANEYARVIHAIFERYHSSLLANKSPSIKAIYLFGTQNETDFAEQLTASLPHKLQDFTHNLAGKTNWKSLTDALTGLDVLLSPDTGTAHLAAHLGVPVEGFFLSSASCFETGPYGLGHTIWQPNLPCFPCMEFQDCSQKELICHNYFANPHFLMELQGIQNIQSSNEAPNIIRYSSSFQQYKQQYEQSYNSHTTEQEPFGLTWQAENTSHKSIPHFEKRKKLRALLEGYSVNTKYARNSDAVYFDEFLYHESDWIFPQSQP